MATGVVVAFAGSIISNTQHYPGTVTNIMQITAPNLGKDNTTLTWFVGFPKNVSVSVRPNSYIGYAHVRYSVDAASLDCGNVTLTPNPKFNDTSACAGTSGGVAFGTNSKHFDGSATRYWYYNMTFSETLTSVWLNISMIQD